MGKPTDINSIPSVSQSKSLSDDYQAEDKEDLEIAQEQAAECEEQKPWWKCLGPGLVTGAADDDPSGIGTYSVTGAQFGYGMLWLVPFCLPLMIVVQEMCGRVGVITGKGLAAVIKDHYPKWLLYGSVFLLLAANVINIYADLNVMAASAKMLFHGPYLLWLTGLTVVLVASQILIPYRQYVRLLKWLCLTLGAYIITALLPGVHNNWGEVAPPLRNTFVELEAGVSDDSRRILGNNYLSLPVLLAGRRGSRRGDCRRQGRQTWPSDPTGK